MERTPYTPKRTFGCDYCGWIGNYHNCHETFRLGLATVDEFGNFLPRHLESEAIQIRKNELLPSEWHTRFLK